MSVLLSDLQDEIRSEGRATAVRRRRRRTATGGIALAGAMVAFFAAALSPSGPAERLVGPDAAIASVGRDLNGGQVLEWTRRLSYFPGDAGARRESGHGIETTWTDLQTGAHHQLVEGFRRGSTDADPNARTEGWAANGVLWSLDGAPGSSVTKIPIDDDVDTPIDELKRTLQRAERGEIDRTTATLNGTPAVLLTERITNETDVTKKTWISRDAEPRILKEESVLHCHDGWACDATPGDGKQTDIASEYITEKWALLERTRTVLREVEIPESLKTRAAP